MRGLGIYSNTWPISLSLFVLIIIPFIGLIPSPVAGSENTADSVHVFATVNGEIIEHSAYRNAVRAGARQRFYHGKPPEAEILAYQQEISDMLVDQMLMHQEAVRRGINPDSRNVEVELGRLIQQYVDVPGRVNEKQQLVPLLRQSLERRDRVRQLEESLRNSIAEPSEETLIAYYKAHPKTFTSPSQERVSIILLKLPPWASGVEWEGKREQAENIYDELNQGLSFDEAARRYSDDPTAASGGDMGYLHTGMLGDAAEDAIAKLNVGEVSQAVVLLEGVALFLLRDRIESKLNAFEKVHERARRLWIREQKDLIVKQTKQRLRNSAEIHYSDSTESATWPRRDG